MTQGAILHVLVLLLSFIVKTVSVPPLPEWPTQFQSCVNVFSEREQIKAGWYVDGDTRRMRLDSYVIPAGMNQTTAEIYQYYVHQVEDLEYACSQFGPPLYMFLYHYDVGKMFSLFPSPDPPYRDCTVTNIFNKFPSSPLFPDVEFVGEVTDNITTYNHWRTEFFLFTMDYMFHASNGLPYKLIVNGEENVFLSIEEGAPSQDTFYPPRGVVCKPAE